MVDLSQRLLRARGRSEALRAAQKAMIANPAARQALLLGRFPPHRQLDTSAARGLAQPGESVRNSTRAPLKIVAGFQGGRILPHLRVRC